MHAVLALFIYCLDIYKMSIIVMIVYYTKVLINERQLIIITYRTNSCRIIWCNIFNITVAIQYSVHLQCIQYIVCTLYSLYSERSELVCIGCVICTHCWLCGWRVSCVYLTRLKHGWYHLLRSVTCCYM